MRQSGASLVRFNVYWGWTENAAQPGTNPVQYAGGKQYYFDKLDKAVDLARANGFRVELTITGAAKAKGLNGYYTLDCSPGYNPNGKGCLNNGTAGTGENPAPDAYREFVKQVVTHFTHDPSSGAALVRADYFALWNEPNFGSPSGGLFLNDANPREVPADLYGRLYAAGYLGYIDGLSGVTGTRILFGELSSRQRSGRGAGRQTCATAASGTRKCAYTAIDFFDRAVYSASVYLLSKGLGQQVPMDGLALHPYQHIGRPWDAGPYKLEIGIGKLKKVKTDLKNLCNKDAAGNCTSAVASIKRQDGKQPLLYLTEFGYLVRSVGNGPNHLTSPKKYFREQERATRFAGTSKRKGALQQALDFKAASMLIFVLVETPPGNRQDGTWDSGVIGQPQQYPAGTTDNDIIGCRNYGKPTNGHRWDIGTCPQSTDPKKVAQDRKAYCAIRRWAARAGFFDKRAAPYANACN
jgi:hypothetical protein